MASSLRSLAMRAARGGRLYTRMFVGRKTSKSAYFLVLLTLLVLPLVLLHLGLGIFSFSLHSDVASVPRLHRNFLREQQVVDLLFLLIIFGSAEDLIRLVDGAGRVWSIEGHSGRRSSLGNRERLSTTISWFVFCSTRKSGFWNIVSYVIGIRSEKINFCSTPVYLIEVMGSSTCIRYLKI